MNRILSVDRGTVRRWPAILVSLIVVGILASDVAGGELRRRPKTEDWEAGTVLVRRGAAGDKFVGVVVSDRGDVLVDQDVAEGEGEFEVQTKDRMVSATVVWEDETTDLAQLRIAAGEVRKVIPLGRKQLEPADMVYVLHPEHRITHAVYDATVRLYDREPGLLRLSSAVGPGMTQGAVFNDDGELAGMIVWDGRKGSQGIQFAVPSAEIRAVMDRRAEKK